MRFRGPIWSKDETEMMLEIIKKNNLLATAPSHTQLGHTLEAPMRTMGFERTALQIRFKLKSLRTAYILCKRKGCTPSALEDCPFYKLLDEIYTNANLGKIDADMPSANENAPGYSNIWTDQEMEKMLSIINIMNLSKDLTLQAFTPLALKLVSKGLVMAGYQKDIQQVQTVLMSLRTAYIKNRIAQEKGHQCEPCPYYDKLHEIWGADIISSAEISKSKALKPLIMTNDKLTTNVILKRVPHDKIQWTKKETLVLLDLIDQMILTTEFKFRLSATVIDKFVKPMNDRGYDRSCSQILGKLKNMRAAYLRCVHNGRTQESIKECPFFDRLDKMFQKLKKITTVSKLQLVDHNYGNDKIKDKSTDHSYVNTEGPKESESLWHPVESIIENEDSTHVTYNFDDDEYQNYTEEEIVDHFEVIDIVENQNNSTNLQESSLELPSIPSDNPLVNDSTKNDKQVSPQIKIEVPTVHVNHSTTLPSKKFPLKFVKVIKQDPKNQFLFGKNEASPNEEYVPPIKSSASSIVTSPSLIRSSIPSVTITSPLKSTNSIWSTSNEPITLSPSIPSTSSQTTTHGSDSTIPEAMKTIMEQFLKHEERMHQENRMWMEQQFEIQRKHDRQQRQLLLTELREFRKVFVSTMSQKNS